MRSREGKLCADISGINAGLVPFTPVFYVVVQNLADRLSRRRAPVVIAPRLAVEAEGH